MAKLFVNLTLTINLSEEIVWCNNSNETSSIWQRFYKIRKNTLEFFRRFPLATINKATIRNEFVKQDSAGTASIKESVINECIIDFLQALSRFRLSV